MTTTSKEHELLQLTGSFLFERMKIEVLRIILLLALLYHIFFESTNLQHSLCRYLFRSYTGTQEISTNILQCYTSRFVAVAYVKVQLISRLAHWLARSNKIYSMYMLVVYSIMSNF